MRKILLLLITYLVFAFAVCMGVSYGVGNVPVVLPGQTMMYVLNRALFSFLHVLPALFTSGFLVACAIYFGHHTENTRTRFSAGIIAHFKMTLLASLGMVLVLTLAREVFLPRITARQNLAVAAPELLNEYLIGGRYCLVVNRYVLAYEYARQALKLDPSNKEAQALLDDAERNMNKMRPRREQESTFTPLNLEWRELENETVTSLIEKANKAKDNEQWFNAHYYAQLALALATGADINVQEAQMLASEAWAQLETAEDLVNVSAREFYDKKKRAYSYLMSGDTLEAYYAFLDLQNNTISAIVDPDVKNFYEIARERLAAEAFFIDETLHLQLFESVHNLYFTLTHDDGSRDVIFVRGITAVSNSGRMIQYMRDFSLYTYAPDGSFLRSVFTPYAKMVAEPVSVFDQATAAKYGLSPSYQDVPYIILRSVAREYGRMKNEPVYRFAESVPEDEQFEPGAMILPMPFEDFNLACDAAAGPQQMYLLSLMRMIGKADSFGYSGEVFTAALISRLTYPLLMLIVLIFAAAFAWDYRVQKHQLFKFSWSFVLPFCTIILYPLLEMLLYIEDLICYAIIALLGQSAVAVTIFIYVVFFVLVSAYFMARRSET